MTKSHILIRSKEPRLKAASGLRFLSGLLLGLALAGAVFAQEIRKEFNQIPVLS